MRRGVIDIGTNSVKLLIADLHGGNISPHLETSRQTRLGRGLYADGKLQAEPIEATVAAVNELLALARRNDCGDIRIIATSAVREAANSGELLESLGQAVQILSGDDEARLAFAGAVSYPRLVKQPVVVLDTGGGSTEVIVGDAGGMRFHLSLPLGSVRLMERHAVSDPPSADELAAVRESIDTQLRARGVPELRRQIAALGHEAAPVQLVATGGVASILAMMELGIDDHDRVRMEEVELSLDRMEAWRERLWGLPLPRRREITGLPANRADVALYGSLIVEQSMRQLGFDALRVCTRGIRFGVLCS